MIKLICITFAFSASIEYLQYVFKVGALDVDDICLNVIGSLIGYTFFLLGVYKLNERVVS